MTIAKEIFQSLWPRDNTSGLEKVVANLFLTRCEPDIGPFLMCPSAKSLKIVYIKSR